MPIERKPSSLLSPRQKLWSTVPYDSTWQEPQLPTFPRGLSTYEILLRFNRQLLDNHSVLDFGCGTTNLHQQLVQNHIQPQQVYMVDINPNLSKINPDIITLDGRDLQKRFSSQSINFIFALASTYQIPQDDRFNIFAQFCNIATTAIHIAPIYKPDFDFFSEHAPTQGFDIIACRPFTHSLRDTYAGRELIFEPESIDSYDKFTAKHPPEERIILPASSSPTVKIRFGTFNVDINHNSSYIILKNR